MSVNDVIMQAMRENSIDFVTTVPCKQLQCRKNRAV